ncbi:MAG: hypothetical protein DCE87_07255 [Betaproteobacteria bacterium]|jgi:hypothetical protein|nr:MAG: hypothetical protein DCE87_07255 [Betaproteobacteria bacterium]PZO32013.1 MAG: hypothetical protein DCE88_02270 [Betaproteobacteria bacterium]
MKNMPISRIKIGLCLMLLASPALQAQTPNPAQVEEGDLRACLQLEQQGLKRFNTLEQRASDLRGSEKLLSERRIALQNQKAKLDAGKPDQKAVANFNEAVNTFNLQADRLNADKAEFEKESSTYDNWVNNNLKPVCNKVINKPVNPVTSYYACGFNSTQPLVDVPHCKTLPNLDSLKTCIQKAGSKTAALEACKG